MLTSANYCSNDPVTPNASPEARALLELIYNISGKYMLTGQHNYPNTRDRNSKFAVKYIGETPVVWSTDMGFAEDGDMRMPPPMPPDEKMKPGNPPGSEK